MSIVKHLRTRFRESTKVEQAVASTSSWKMLMRKIWFQRKVGAKHLGERKEGVGYISVNSFLEFTVLKVYKANKRFMVLEDSLGYGKFRFKKCAFA